MKLFNRLTLATLIAITAAFCGCETFQSRAHHRATSVIKFLYPRDVQHVETAAVPVLKLPLKVGVAFVPVEQSKTQHGRAGFFPITDATVNESQKMALMKEVSKHFEKYGFVKNIELIPSAYLTPGGSFANLDQLRSMFDVDVIALLSYDQVQFTDEGLLSLSYLTIVGVYTVAGEKNDTQTMVDAVVFDIASRKMLFRAPGLSHIKGSATPVNLSEQLRHESEAGFQRAASDLITNLDFQLSQFKEHVRKSPEEIKVAARPGYAGAAAIGGLELAALGVMLLASFFFRRENE